MHAIRQMNRPSVMGWESPLAFAGRLSPATDEFQLQRPQAAGASGVNPTCRALKIVSGRVGFSKSKAR
jgi:hypothetical protein